MGVEFSYEEPVKRDYIPSFDDSVRVYLDLLRHGPVKIPAIIAMVLEYADYSPILEISRSERHFGRSDEDECYIEGPMCSLPYFRPHSITFHVTSKDQGWSSYPEYVNTRQASWTWFEASFSCEESVRYELFRNIHASKQWNTEVITYPNDSKLLTRMNELLAIPNNSFRLQLRCRSQYPGWRNNVQDARIVLHFSLVNWEQLAAAYPSTC